jgi:hypothetical protein
MRAGPAGTSLRQVQPVVDQEPVGHRLACRLHQVDGVHVGEPPAKAGDDGIAAVLFDRAPGSNAHSRTVSVTTAASWTLSRSATAAASAVA